MNLVTLIHFKYFWKWLHHNLKGISYEIFFLSEFFGFQITSLDYNDESYICSIFSYLYDNDFRFLSHQTFCSSPLSIFRNLPLTKLTRQFSNFFRFISCIANKLLAANVRLWLSINFWIFPSLASFFKFLFRFYSYEIFVDMCFLFDE